MSIIRKKLMYSIFGVTALLAFSNAYASCADYKGKQRLFCIEGTWKISKTIPVNKGAELNPIPQGNHGYDFLVYEGDFETPWFSCSGLNRRYEHGTIEDIEAKDPSIKVLQLKHQYAALHYLWCSKGSINLLIPEKGKDAYWKWNNVFYKARIADH